MKKVIAILSLLTISYTAHASTIKLGPITGFGYTEYFDFINTTANVLNAHKIDGQQLATADSLNTLSSICRSNSGVIIENTTQTKVIECTMDGVSGSTRAMYGCRVETTVNCLTP